MTHMVAFYMGGNIFVNWEFGPPVQESIKGRALENRNFLVTEEGDPSDGGAVARGMKAWPVGSYVAGIEEDTTDGYEATITLTEIVSS